jgi:hypothetical protein
MVKETLRNKNGKFPKAMYDKIKYKRISTELL